MVQSPLTDSYVMPQAQNHFCRTRTIDIRKPEACNWTGKIIYQNLITSWFNVTSIAKNNSKASPKKRNNSEDPLLAHFCVGEGIFFFWARFWWKKVYIQCHIWCGTFSYKEKWKNELRFPRIVRKTNSHECQTWFSMEHKKRFSMVMGRNLVAQTCPLGQV